MRFLIYVVCAMFLMTGCTTENDTLLSEEENLSFINKNSKNGEEFLLNLKQIATENSNKDKYVEYNLTMDENGAFTIEKSRELTMSRNTDALISYYKREGSFTFSGYTDANNRGSYTVVCCETGQGDPTCVTCDGNQAQQSTCVIGAINDCSNNGGCSVVCPSDRSILLYNPKEGVFTIYKSHF
jgi:hypothetical protein